MLFTLTCGLLLSIGGVIKQYKTVTAEGVYWCADETDNTVTVKLPPVQGQFMARTRDQIIDHFDFDLRAEQKGAWLWKSEVQKNLNTTVRLPKTDLPIVLTYASAQTGVQTATILMRKIDSPMSVTYTCNNELKSTVSGAGSCLGLSGSVNVITVPDSTENIKVIRYVGCSDTNMFELKEDCIMSIREMTPTSTRYANIIYKIKKEDLLLPPPSIVNNKWMKPFLATVWQDEGRCAFAWSDKSFSWSCK